MTESGAKKKTRRLSEEFENGIAAQNRIWLKESYGGTTQREQAECKHASQVWKEMMSGVKKTA